MKKVLFITYYWPPAGGAPINRILKFYQYLHEFGWEPVILTTQGGDFPFEDESLLKEIRPDSKIYRSKGLSVHKIFSSVSPKSKKNFIPYGFTQESKGSVLDKLSRWVKYNMIPDSRFPWYFSTVGKALKIVKSENIQLIFSSSPPQTNHMIAKRVAQKTGLPWVADFRDPWTDVFWLLDRSIRWNWIHSIDKYLEKKTIARMDGIVTVGKSLVEILQRKTSKQIHLISNGFDEPYFRNLFYHHTEKFTITYAGSMSQEQSPDGFIRALESLKKVPGFYNDLNLVFMGNFPPFLFELLEKSEIHDKLTFLPYTYYLNSLETIAKSDLLLMIVPQTKDNKCILTSKLFDYIGANRPVIAFGPVDGDAGEILSVSKSGKIFDYADVENASEFILNCYQSWKSNSGECSNSINARIDQFTRKNLTKQLSEIFDSLVK